MSSFTLIIKAPNQKIADQTVECSPEWTVRTLKSYLSQVYPTNPSVEDQKLIYSGRLLHDHLALKDIFRLDEGRTRVLHLVCMQSSQDLSRENESSRIPSPTPPSRSSSNEAISTQVNHSNNNTSSASTADAAASAASSAFSPDGLRQRMGPQEVPRVSQSFPFPLQTNGPVMTPYQITPEQMAQQMAVMQQFYAQYFSLYSQYLGGQAGIVPSSIQPSATANVPLAAGANINGRDQNLPVPDRPAAEVNRMNVQGGPMQDDDDDEMRNRDWLDWFYLFTRVLLFLSIVLFYSSFGRFMVVTGLGILLYLYQTGFFAGIWQRQANQNQQNQPNQNNNEAEGADRGNRHLSPAEQRVNRPPRNREAQNAEEIEAMMDGDIDPSAPQNARPSPLRMALTIVTALFTSLIPEPPAPLNVN